MSQTLHLFLRCINYNDCFVTAGSDGLILKNSTKASALWAAQYCFSTWTLVHQASSMRLTFDTKNKLISSSEENKSLEVKHGDRRLFLRFSSAACDTVGNKLGLELFAENDPNGKAFAVFLICEGFNQIFRHIDTDFFNSHPTHNKIITDIAGNHYDYILIGSSFCTLASIHQISQKNSKPKFLVLEKGLKYLSEHHQHCSTPLPTAGEVEFRPWSISPETIENEYVQNVCGQIPSLGGRSTHWSGWSPTPSTKELAEWPKDLKGPLQETYFGLAQKFLGVIAANEINAFENNNYLYRTFQSGLKSRLNSADTIESVEHVLHAPLAMGNDRSIKFSTVEMLLSMENVTVIYDCAVEKILHDGKKPTALQTSQGPIVIPNNSKLILAMSTLPATTLVLNSFKKTEFPQLSNVGKRFSAHFVSSVIARVPRQNLSLPDDAPDVELGAVYIPGSKDGARYHLQLSAVAYTQRNDNKNIHDICKKYSANSIPKECIDRSRDDVVVSCSTLGELDYKNKTNQFNLANNNQSLTANGELTFRFNDQDKQLWDLMDSVTFKVMNKLSCSENNDDIEYWHENDKKWKKNIPLSDQIRKKTLAHDASTMWIGDNEDTEAPVGLDYRLRGVDNVYLTGGALWPTGGSWNPVLTIVAMAMHLADTI